MLRVRAATVDVVISSITAAHAIAAPTDGKTAYRLERIGRNAVIRYPPTNHIAPASISRPRAPTLGLARSPAAARSTAIAPIVAPRSTYSIAFRRTTAGAYASW